MNSPDRKAAANLLIADALSRLCFFGNQPPGAPHPALLVRIEDGIQNLTKAEMERFITDLNAAIDPVRKAYAAKHRKAARAAMEASE